mmetsp:Transcript_55657/g.131424  ORF Transcript_55657/g.131424 Transcript_55657/m.131424 type:complete len:102 (-) Transcript_55657:301-606(-)
MVTGCAALPGSRLMQRSTQNGEYWIAQLDFTSSPPTVSWEAIWKGQYPDNDLSHSFRNSFNNIGFTSGPNDVFDISRNTFNNPATQEAFGSATYVLRQYTF